MKKIILPVLILALNSHAFSNEINYKLKPQRKKVEVQSVVGHMRVVVEQKVVMPANEKVAAQAISMFKKGKYFCDVKIAQFHHSSSDGFYMIYEMENCQLQDS